VLDPRLAIPSWRSRPSRPLILNLPLFFVGSVLFLFFSLSWRLSEWALPSSFSHRGKALADFILILRFSPATREGTTELFSLDKELGYPFRLFFSYDIYVHLTSFHERRRASDSVVNRPRRVETSLRLYGR